MKDIIDSIFCTLCAKPAVSIDNTNNIPIYRCEYHTKQHQAAKTLPDNPSIKTEWQDDEYLVNGKTVAYYNKYRHNGEDYFSIRIFNTEQFGHDTAEEAKERIEQEIGDWLKTFNQYSTQSAHFNHEKRIPSP